MTREWFELLIVACLALFLSLTGCTGMLIGNALGQGQSLTPEQVAEFRKQNQKVYSCTQVSGPPPSGMAIWLIMPAESQFNPKFADGCRLVQ